MVELCHSQVSGKILRTCSICLRFVELPVDKELATAKPPPAPAPNAIPHIGQSITENIRRVRIDFLLRGRGIYILFTKLLNDGIENLLESK